MRSLLALLLLFTNLAWAVAYRSLWYDAAQAEGMLDQAETQLRMIHYRVVHHLEDEQDNGIPQPEGLR